MSPNLEQDLGFLLARTHRAMHRWLTAQIEALGITYEQFVVLTHLWEKDGISQSELAERAFMDKTSLARMLGRMENADLIRRDVDAKDSRVNRVTLTAEGRAIRNKVNPLRRRGLRQAVQGLSEEEVHALKRLLDHVFHNMSS